MRDITIGLTAETTGGTDEIIPFIRKKMELYTYLVDVYYFTDNKEKYSETIKTIKKANEKYKDIGLFTDIKEL